MKVLLCVDPSDAERMTRKSVNYLAGASEVVVLCAVDEGGPRGIGMSMRGLLGRRSRATGLEATSESVARESAEKTASSLSTTLSQAEVQARTVTGRPEEEISRLASGEGFDAVLIGRGNTGPEVPVTLTGTVAGFKTNHAGDTDGLYLDTGDKPEPVEIKFPPHRGREMLRSFPEGTTAEVSGSKRGDSVHAFTLAAPGKEPVEAHRPPAEKEGGLMHVHLGHTARFVTDHVTCDVVLVS